MITIAELCAWGLPNILVPLPTAAADHQTYNARVLAEAGASLLLPQSELSPTRLASEINALLGSPDRRQQMAQRALTRGRPNSAQEIVYKLLTLMA
jgi:UDP-N-acetylglucosamine--N-acetylmuramyl-(pentapeptide) pyrophosphoryl-undecaprenol N-acetylglucosamine transferase